MTERPHKPGGVWQFAAFAVALVLALFVWGLFPEPEESRRGYTPKGCYESGKMYFNDARRLKGPAHDYPRSERYLSAVRYFEALARRFGIGPLHGDAYEMLADARHELALAGEADPILRESFQLDAPDALRQEALDAYREALARMDADAPGRPVVLRKQAEVLVELGAPGELDEALEILRRLVKLYRQSKVDLLRRERGEHIRFARGGVQVPAESAAELAQEARTAYFLAGLAAVAASDVHLAATGEAASRQIREEEEDLAAARSGEAARFFRLFIEAGGAGERRVRAEKALGDLAFRRARRLTGEDRRAALGDARTHYKAAGTRETAFLLARVLFGLGEYADAKRRFAHREDVPPAESRARAYMRARCDLATDELEDAGRAFAEIQERYPETAEAASALVGLARIALAQRRLELAAGLLRRAVAAEVREPSGIDLPERDGELEPGRIAGMLASVARESDGRGEFDQAISLYRDAARRDPRGPAPSLKLIARAWEGKADAATDPAEKREALAKAAETYLGLAGELAPGPARREAERFAAERFAEGGHYSPAIEAARGFVVRYPDDLFTSRVLHELGSWEAELGLSERAEGHFRENVERHPTDVYADRSHVGLAELLAARGTDEGLREAAGELHGILGNERRYGRKSLVRLEALFMLGHVQLRRAERLVLAGDDPGGARILLAGAAKAFDAALAFKEADFPADARPLFAKLMAEQGPPAVKALATASAGLARIEGEAPAAEPVGPGELDRRWKELSAEIDSFRAELARAGEVTVQRARKD